jgi:hypothetical protein
MLPKMNQTAIGLHNIKSGHPSIRQARDRALLIALTLRPNVPNPYGRLMSLIDMPRVE